jgi:hypothetical protein
MKLKIKEIPDAYGRNRQYAVTFGISHLAYGETPEDAIIQFEKYFNEKQLEYELQIFNGSR